MEQARTYADCFRIVEQKVKPERSRNQDRRRREIWWQFTRPTLELYATIAGMEKVLVRSRIADKHSMAFVPASWVCNEKVVVFPQMSFVVMQSGIHEVWARNYSSSLRNDMQYTPTDCFETFPFPATLDGLEGIGVRYHAYRQQIMLTQGEGLTKTYNRFHDPEESRTNIQQLRELHVEMDQAVAAAYGWSDLNLDHGFHETKHGVRYTISEAARRLVLARLLTLNHERYAAEVQQGLHETKAKRPATSKPKVKVAKQNAATKRTLFGQEDVDPAFPSTKRDKLLCGMLCDLVAAQPGLSATAYLDALVIALRPKRHNRLLIGTERKEFTTLAEKLLPAKERADASIPWYALLDSLTADEAIRQGKLQDLVRGSRFEDVRKLYPPSDPKLIGLIQKAAVALRDVQSLGTPAPADSQEALFEFNEDKRTLCGTAP
jgi:hypothetical protein